mgnify:CR=1 FL=1
MKNDNNQFDIRTTYTHTVNPETGREVVIGGDRFFKLMEHGYKYDAELNRLYEKPLPPGTPKYIPKPRILSPKNRYMVVGGSAYYELLRDNYRRVRGEWVKMSKEELEAYDNIDPKLKKRQQGEARAPPDSDSDSDYPDIDEFEYDADGHAIFPL